MMYCICDDRAELPKIALEKLQCMEKSIPSGYPNSSTKFSLEFDSKEINDVVIKMENEIRTESSVITSDILPENTILGACMGTYDVKGVAGEKCLVSPTKVPSNAAGVLVLHYNETDNTWNKVENAEIINGYVYATLDSFSPISVFVLNRATCLYPSIDGIFNAPVFVANGVPVRIVKDESGKVIAIDGNNKVTELPDGVTIFGGTIDGSHVESTSISMVGIKNNKVKHIFAGSISNDNVVFVNKANISIIDCTMGNVTGAMYKNKINQLNIFLKDTKCNFVGSANTINSTTKKDCNISLSSVSLSSDSYVKEANYQVDNSTVSVFYIGGNNGYSYTLKGFANITNSDIDYMITSGSNGKSENMKLVAENTKFNILQTTNRGYVTGADVKLNKCSTNLLALLGDPTDKTVNGYAKDIKFDINNSIVNDVCTGTNGGIDITDASSLEDLVKSFKINRKTIVSFKTDKDKVLISPIIIKK